MNCNLKLFFCVFESFCSLMIDLSQSSELDRLFHRFPATVLQSTCTVQLRLQLFKHLTYNGVLWFLCSAPWTVIWITIRQSCFLLCFSTIIMNSPEWCPARLLAHCSSLCLAHPWLVYCLSQKHQSFTHRLWVCMPIGQF